MRCRSASEQHAQCLLNSSTGDKQQPTCTRCKEKGLVCRPVQRKSVFRQGSTAKLDGHFSKDQSWMSSQPRKWKLFSGDSSLPESMDMAQSPSPYQESTVQCDRPASGETDRHVWTRDNGSHRGSHFEIQSSPHYDPSRNGFQHVVSGDTANVNGRTYIAHEWNSVSTPTRNPSINGMQPSSTAIETQSAFSTPEPTQTSVQEACLLRHFIEEISPWVSHQCLTIPLQLKHLSSTTATTVDTSN